jgi:hypothetical protein
MAGRRSARLSSGGAIDLGSEGASPSTASVLVRFRAHIPFFGVADHVRAGMEVMSRQDDHS